MGGRSAGDEWRSPASPPISLAVGRPQELRRRAACRKRPTRRGRECQYDGPPRGRVEALADRSPGIAGAGWNSATMARGAPGGGASIAAAPTTADATQI